MHESYSPLWLTGVIRTLALIIRLFYICKRKISGTSIDSRKQKITLKQKAKLNAQRRGIAKRWSLSHFQAERRWFQHHRDARERQVQRPSPGFPTSCTWWDHSGTQQTSRYVLYKKRPSQVESEHRIVICLRFLWRLTWNNFLTFYTPESVTQILWLFPLFP